MTLEELQAILQPSQADRDNALNMGLLQAGLGILAHNTNKSNPMPALGAGGLMGLQGYQQSMQNFPLEKLRSLQAMSAMQGIEKGDMELKALKDQLAMKERIRKRMSGEQPKANPEPYGGGYSPVVASAFGIPQASPQSAQNAAGGLNQSLSDSFIRQAQIYSEEGDIEGANKLYEHAAKFLPQVEKMSVEMVGGKPMNVILFKDGTHKIAPFAPVDKKEYKDIGGSLMPVSGITGDILSGNIAKTMTPGEVASNKLGWFNAQKPQFNAEAGGFVNLPTKDAPNGSITQIPGFTKKAPEAYLKQAAGIQTTIKAADDYANQLESWTKSKTLSPTARAEMGTSYRNMLLQAKEAYGLGVLNGPDLQILESIINNPLDPSSVIVPNEAMISQARKLQYLLTKTHQGLASVYGQTPPPDMPNPSDKKSAISNDGWSARRK